MEEIRTAIAQVLSAPVHDTPVSTPPQDLPQPFTLPEIQAWLAQLPREVAEAIAWKNGERLFPAPAAP